MNKKRKRTTILSESARFSFMLVAVLLSLALVFSIFQKQNERDSYVAASVEEESVPTVILDAGHGGIDSGAISVYGDEEKHLNLALAQKLGAFLESAGVRVIYTRDEDTMVESKEDYSTRKTRDLMGRVEIAEEYPDALFVSIHMNTLPAAQYKGLQIFYSTNNDANRALAQVMQNTVSEALQPENGRTVKDAEGKIFILDRLEQPAILIECGFISNAEEATLLKDEAYQAKLAYVLSRPILNFLSER